MLILSDVYEQTAHCTNFDVNLTQNQLEVLAIVASKNAKGGGKVLLLVLTTPTDV